MKAAALAESARLRVVVRGAVQGVGFRPFVWRLAGELSLAGWVGNASSGVVIEVEGPPAALATFLARLPREKPPLAVLQGLEHSVLDPAAYERFEIRESDVAGSAATLVLPDVATCEACRREIFDPRDRRFRYPFTNCTHCGPRFSIVESLPYDRSRTTMKSFPMCDRCRAEYENPGDRRFHAQPIACPDCGPQLALLDAEGRTTAIRGEALAAAAAAIRDGRVVAVKSVGGYHLLASALDERAVRTLRARKHREEKPFALLYPSIAALRRDAEVSTLEEILLGSPEAPIVLVRRRPAAGIAPSVAAGSPSIGAMLPSNPLHHLLAADLGIPLVATSGNRSEEPICIDESDALDRLSGVADLFLVNDRPIARPVDDSIVRVMAGRATILRRARGYAPLPIPIGRAVGPALAVGAHMKSAIAIGVGEQAVVSQHIGDLDSARCAERLARTADDLRRLFAVEPVRAASDAHPDYASTRYADSLRLPALRVQHHHAHVLACMAENELEPPFLGIAWDGTGLGLDGTIWGGEFLHVTAAGFRRAAHLRTFRLPGGERAIREPRRAALGLLCELFGERLPDDLEPVRSFTASERATLVTMLRKGVRAPVTSSAGRLFDGVAALLGLCQRATFEGQAAMALEEIVEERSAAPPYDDASVDWEPILRGVIGDLRGGVARGRIAARFHESLAAAIVGVARRIGEERVLLTGGCFQNRVLTERAVDRLAAAGFRPYWHQRVPPNDGGIAFGQLVALAMAGE